MKLLFKYTSDSLEHILFIYFIQYNLDQKHLTTGKK